MRRSDRAIASDSEIEALLQDAQTGFTATSDEGQPFINSNLYWYDAHTRRIYIHTAAEGRTRSNIEKNPRVCFSVGEMGALLPASEATQFSVEYAGVTSFGQARIVADAQEARHGLQGLLDKYFPHLRPGEHYRPISAADLAQTTVIAIDIEVWSGKRKSAQV